MANCKECGTYIGKENYDAGRARASMPFWLWLFPIPFASGFILHCVAPNFCGDGCKTRWMQRNANWWKKALLMTHVVYPLVILLIVFAAKNNNSEQTESTSTQETQQVSKDNDSVKE